MSEEVEVPSKEDRVSHANTHENYSKDSHEKDSNTKAGSNGKMTLWQKIKAPRGRLITLIVIFGILLVGLGAYAFVATGKKTTSTGATIKGQETKVAAPLDGVMGSTDVAKRHPLAIVVENHPDARPQTGLDKASIVYEAIAEGGITRFMAIYGTSEADKVGPVRSARTFFVDWVLGYNAWLGHVGGNMDALDQIKADKVLDLDQFAYSGPYWREPKKGLATEHTMYTTSGKLRDQAAKNKYSADNSFKVYKFKDDPAGAAKEALPDAQKVAVNFSTATYNVVYDYDKTTNSYKRSMAGKPHNDQVTGAQLNPKNVIVMTVARKSTVTRINENGYTMTTIGSGAAKIFLDGKTITGTWKKESKTSREVFLDEAGQEIIFNRGQFWIAVIPPEGSVTAQ